MEFTIKDQFGLDPNIRIPHAELQAKRKQILDQLNPILARLGWDLEDNGGDGLEIKTRVFYNTVEDWETMQTGLREIQKVLKGGLRTVHMHVGRDSLSKGFGKKKLDVDAGRLGRLAKVFEAQWRALARKGFRRLGEGIVEPLHDRALHDGNAVNNHIAMINLSGRHPTIEIKIMSGLLDAGFLNPNELQQQVFWAFSLLDTVAEKEERMPLAVLGIPTVAGDKPTAKQVNHFIDLVFGRNVAHAEMAQDIFKTIAHEPAGLANNSAALQKRRAEIRAIFKGLGLSQVYDLHAAQEGVDLNLVEHLLKPATLRQLAADLVAAGHADDEALGFFPASMHEELLHALQVKRVFAPYIKGSYKYMVPESFEEASHPASLESLNRAFMTYRIPQVDDPIDLTAYRRTDFQVRIDPEIFNQQIALKPLTTKLKPASSNSKDWIRLFFLIAMIHAVSIAPLIVLITHFLPYELGAVGIAGVATLLLMLRAALALSPSWINAPTYRFGHALTGWGIILLRTAVSFVGIGRNFLMLTLYQLLTEVTMLKDDLATSQPIDSVPVENEQRAEIKNQEVTALPIEEHPLTDAQRFELALKQVAIRHGVAVRAFFERVKVSTAAKQLALDLLNQGGETWTLNQAKYLLKLIIDPRVDDQAIELIQRFIGKPGIAEIIRRAGIQSAQARGALAELEAAAALQDEHSLSQVIELARFGDLLHHGLGDGDHAEIDGLAGHGRIFIEVKDNHVQDGDVTQWIVDKQNQIDDKIGKLEQALRVHGVFQFQGEGVVDPAGVEDLIFAVKDHFKNEEEREQARRELLMHAEAINQKLKAEGSPLRIKVKVVFFKGHLLVDPDGFGINVAMPARPFPNDGLKPLSPTRRNAVSGVVSEIRRLASQIGHDQEHEEKVWVRKLAGVLRAGAGVVALGELALQRNGRDIPKAQQWIDELHAQEGQRFIDLLRAVNPNHPIQKRVDRLKDALTKWNEVHQEKRLRADLILPAGLRAQLLRKEPIAISGRTIREALKKADPDIRHALFDSEGNLRPFVAFYDGNDNELGLADPLPEGQLRILGRVLRGAADKRPDDSAFDTGDANALLQADSGFGPSTSDLGLRGRRMDKPGDDPGMPSYSASNSKQPVSTVVSRRGALKALAFLPLAGGVQAQTRSPESQQEQDVRAGLRILADHMARRFPLMREENRGVTDLVRKFATGRIRMVQTDEDVPWTITVDRDATTGAFMPIHKNKDGAQFSDAWPVTLNVTPAGLEFIRHLPKLSATQRDQAELLMWLFLYEQVAKRSPIVRFGDADKNDLGRMEHDLRLWITQELNRQRDSHSSQDTLNKQLTDNGYLGQMIQYYMILLARQEAAGLSLVSEYLNNKGMGLDRLEPDTLNQLADYFPAAAQRMIRSMSALYWAIPYMRLRLEATLTKIEADGTQTQIVEQPSESAQGSPGEIPQSAYQAVVDRYLNASIPSIFGDASLGQFQHRVRTRAESIETSPTNLRFSAAYGGRHSDYMEYLSRIDPERLTLTNLRQRFAPDLSGRHQTVLKPWTENEADFNIFEEQRSNVKTKRNNNSAWGQAGVGLLAFFKLDFVTARWEWAAMWDILFPGQTAEDQETKVGAVRVMVEKVLGVIHDSDVAIRVGVMEHPRRGQALSIARTYDATGKLTAIEVSINRKLKISTLRYGAVHELFHALEPEAHGVWNRLQEEITVTRRTRLFMQDYPTHLADSLTAAARIYATAAAAVPATSDDIQNHDRIFMNLYKVLQLTRDRDLQLQRDLASARKSILVQA